MPDAPTPIQEVVAWLRGGHHWKNYTRWADAIEAQGREIGRLCAIIRVNLLRHVPGATHEAIDRLIAGEIEHTNPSEGQGGADRDAALVITHLPGSAPPLGSPVPYPKGGFATNEEESVWLAERLLLRINQTLRARGLNANFTANRLDEFLLLALDSSSKRARKPILAALKAARDMITKDREEIADVAELSEFWGGGEWRKDRSVAEYDAVLAQIDEVTK